MNCVATISSNSISNPGKLIGTCTFHQCSPDSMTVVHIRVKGLPPNTKHGFHYHRCGELTKGCGAACEHFNPTGQMHGSMKLFGKNRHAGDGPNNIVADANGQVDFIYIDDMITLQGPFSVAGRSVVIHDKPDDLGALRYDTTTQGKESGVTGNAGARIACASIVFTDKDFHPSREELDLAKRNTSVLYGGI